MERPFQDIRMTGIDMDKSYDASARDGTHRIYLILSDVPPPIWRDIFHHQRRTPLYTNARDAIIEDGFMIVTCTPEALEKEHLRFIQEEVRTTNKKYMLFLVQQDKRATGFQQTEQELKKRLQVVYPRLEFD